MHRCLFPILPFLIFPQVAHASGHESASQIWLLLGAAIATYVPDFPPSPPVSPRQLSKSPSPFAQSSPRPPSSTAYSFPPSLSGKTATGSSSPAQKISPGRRSTSGSLSRMPSSSNTRRLTPNSSTNSSPRHLPVGLPPITPRRPSFFGRRESVDAGVLGHGMLRRPSLSVAPGLGHSHTHSLQNVPTHGLHHSSSPNERGTPSLRHVGEGVLDSDSSSSGDGDEGDAEGEETAGANTSDEEGSQRPLIFPALTSGATALRLVTAPIPSPLSRVAGRQAWTDEEEDTQTAKIAEENESSSPSPQSTSDTDSHSSTLFQKRSRSHSLTSRGLRTNRSTGRLVKSRSRSSTVASLAAPPSRPLTHHDSHSSIRTVTAGEPPFKDQEEVADADEAGNHPLPPPPPPSDFRPGHKRRKSQPISEFMMNISIKGVEPYEQVREEEESPGVPDESHRTDRAIQIVCEEEMRFKETTLSALKDALEEFSEEVCDDFIFLMV